MEWYIPITILPGIGVLLMSSATLTVAMYSDIKGLMDQQHINHDFLKSKVAQLNLLSSAMVGFYIACALMVLAGLASGFNLPHTTMWESLTRVLMLVGVIATTISLFLLVLYSIKAVRMRRQQFVERLEGKG